MPLLENPLQQSAGKVMVSAFWDSSGILFIHYLGKGKTINSDYYYALLDPWKEEITKKRPNLLKKKCIFLQDNAQSRSKIFWRPRKIRKLPPPSTLKKYIFFRGLAPLLRWRPRQMPQSPHPCYGSDNASPGG